MPAIIGIVGVSGSGKTTLIERIIPLLRERGLRIGTLKHDAHGFDVDKPGKDTWRHREAGAEVVVISGPEKIACIRRVAEAPSPEALIRSLMPDMDLVLVEGFKRFGFPKLEVVRAANSQSPVTPPDGLSGLVTDLPLSLPDVPSYGLDDLEAIAHRIVELAGRARHG
ncbi:Molybdopterin-guanine dinucleotide biosynthesis adapter protein [compost metagenome]